MSRAVGQIDSNTPQRERDLRPPRQRPGSSTRTRLSSCDRREPPGDGHPVRPSPDAPVLDLPRARVRHPDPVRGRLAGPLPAPDGGDQAEPADHRPVPRADARRPDHGQAAPADPAAAGSGVVRHRGAARRLRRLRDLGRLRPAIPPQDPRPELHPPPGGGRAPARPPPGGHDGDHGPWTWIMGGVDK
jgi:hypothetical protein